MSATTVKKTPNKIHKQIYKVEILCGRLEVIWCAYWTELVLIDIIGDGCELWIFSMFTWAMGNTFL